MKRTTTFLRYAGALAGGLAVLCASARASAQEAQVDSGFALATSLSLHAGLLSQGGTLGKFTLPPSNSMEVGLLAGYKTGRLIIGLGLDFLNQTTNSTATVGMVTVTNSTSSSAFAIGPEVSFALLRVADNRVELFGDLALHFGHWFISGFNGAGPNDPSNFVLTYQLGPGVRYWAHKHFAIQALTGFAGELIHTIPPSAANSGTQDTSAHSILGQFGMLGVF